MRCGAVPSRLCSAIGTSTTRNALRKTPSHSGVSSAVTGADITRSPLTTPPPRLRLHVLGSAVRLQGDPGPQKAPPLQNKGMKWHRGDNGGGGGGGVSFRLQSPRCVSACLRANELIPVPALSSSLCSFIYFLFDTQHKPGSTFSQLQPSVLVN